MTSCLFVIHQVGHKYKQPDRKSDVISRIIERTAEIKSGKSKKWKNVRTINHFKVRQIFMKKWKGNQKLVWFVMLDPRRSRRDPIESVNRSKNFPEDSGK